MKYERIVYLGLLLILSLFGLYSQLEYEKSYTSLSNWSDNQIGFYKSNYNRLVDRFNRLSINYTNLSLRLNLYAEYARTNFSEFRQTGNLLQGFARGDEYYCIWTKDQSYTEINETINHELLHVLLAKDKSHFCG